jgi:hypothetical protein
MEEVLPLVLGEARAERAPAASPAADAAYDATEGADGAAPDEAEVTEEVEVRRR